MLFCHKKKLSKCSKVKRVEYAVRKKIKRAEKICCKKWLYYLKMMKISSSNFNC